MGGEEGVCDIAHGVWKEKEAASYSLCIQMYKGRRRECALLSLLPDCSTPHTHTPHTDTTIDFLSPGWLSCSDSFISFVELFMEPAM